MNFKLLIISKLYPEYLEKYHKKNPHLKKEKYNFQYDHLLNDASEFISSYTKTLKKLGIDVTTIISNSKTLQKTWYSEFIRNGEKDAKTIILNQIEYYGPTVLWIENTNYIDKEFISLIQQKNPNIKLVFSYFCAPYNKRLIENLKCLDFMITCTPGFKESFENQGIKSFLVYHGFDPKVLSAITKTDSLKTRDKIVFTGSLFLGGGFHNERTELIEKLINKNLPVTIYGNLEANRRLIIKRFLFYINLIIKNLSLTNIIKKIPLLARIVELDSSYLANYSKNLKQKTLEPVFGIEMLSALQNSDIVLNKHIAQAGEYAGNMRIFEATGVGACLLTDNKKNLNDIFDVGKEIIVYNSIDDCINKLNSLLKDPKKCKEIAMAGQARTLKDHSVEQRCKQIVRIIEMELQNKNE